MALVLALADLAKSPSQALFEGRRHGGVEVSCFVTATPPGEGLPLHVHPYAEVHVVQDGQATFTVGDEELVVGGGHVVVVPPETPHRFRNTGDGLLRQVSIHPNGEVQETWLEE